MLTSSKRRASSLGNHPNPLTRRTSVPYARTSAGDAAALAAPAAVRVTGGRLRVIRRPALAQDPSRSGRAFSRRRLGPGTSRSRPLLVFYTDACYRCTIYIPGTAAGARFVYRVPQPVHDLYTGYRSRCTIYIPGTAAGARFVYRVPRPVLVLYTGGRYRCSICIPGTEATAGARFLSRVPLPVHDLYTGYRSRLFKLFTR